MEQITIAKIQEMRKLIYEYKFDCSRKHSEIFQNNNVYRCIEECAELEGMIKACTNILKWFDVEFEKELEEVL